MARARLTNDCAYRTLGWAGEADRLGVGFIDKAGVRVDFVDTVPESLVLVAVLRGRGVYVDHCGRRTPLEAGWVFQRTPGRIHTTLIDPASDWRECFLHLGDVLHRSLVETRILRDDLTAWRCPLVDRLPERVADLQRRLLEAAEDALPPVAIDLLELAVQLQGTANPTADEAERAVRDTCRYLGEAFGESRNLQAYCAQHGLGYERLRKRFQQHVGTSPHRYRIRRRLDAACDLLTTTRLPVKAIAERLAYASPFEFSAQFKRHLGVSPSRFRGR